LLVKVDEYKDRKGRKEERKKKWELWKKTQAMVWKKTSTNYSKWDYYTSSSEEEDVNKDPIVPKDDPNFKAMEKDMDERAKKRKLDRINAESWKNKGNDAMKNQDFKKAVEYYSEGLDIIKVRLFLYKKIKCLYLNYILIKYFLFLKDIKPLWTNRALAYIKLRKFKKAIDDCTRVIEYAECFEDGFEKSRDFCFKVFFLKR
jgi:tetratricopeptide (TPR) repeat protein